MTKLIQIDALMVIIHELLSCFSVSVPAQERVTLMTGAKTTVTFGPAVKDLQARGVGMLNFATGNV